MSDTLTMTYPQQPANYPPPYVPQHPPQPRNGFGVTALVLGIVGAVFGLIPFLGLFAIILGALALIFGILGWSNAHKRVATNKGMSIAGTVLGTVALLLGIIGMVIVGQAVEDLDQDLDKLDSELSSIAPPPT